MPRIKVPRVSGGGNPLLEGFMSTVGGGGKKTSADSVSQALNMMMKQKYQQSLDERMLRNLTEKQAEFMTKMEEGIYNKDKDEFLKAEEAIQKDYKDVAKNYNEFLKSEIWKNIDQTMKGSEKADPYTYGQNKLAAFAADSEGSIDANKLETFLHYKSISHIASAGRAIPLQARLSFREEMPDMTENYKQVIENMKMAAQHAQGMDKKSLKEIGGLSGIASAIATASAKPGAKTAMETAVTSLDPTRLMQGLIEGK